MPEPVPRPRPGRPIGVGIVGLSAVAGFACRAHAPALASVDGLELRALAASSPTTAQAASARHGVPGFDSVQGVAARDDVDLVVISVKVPLHHRLVSAALDAGKPVLCEWPLANGVAEAVDLAARARGVRTFVGLQGRSAPALRYLRDLVEDGHVGAVRSTTLVGAVAQWGPTLTGGAYLLDRSNGATLLTIPLGHALDAFTMVLGELSSVTATIACNVPVVRDPDTGRELSKTAEDQVAITGVVGDGAVAAIHYRGGPETGTALLWEIHGTEAVLRVTGPSGQLQHGAVTIWSSAAGELTVPSSYDRFPALAGSPAHSVAHEYAQIRDDLLGDTTVAPSFDHAVALHRLLDDIEAAAGWYR